MFGKIRQEGVNTNMSRVVNMPITVPAGVEVKLEGNHITVKGPKGSLERDIHTNIKV